MCEFIRKTKHNGVDKEVNFIRLNEKYVFDDLEELLNKDEIVYPNRQIDILFKYPFYNYKVFTLTNPEDKPFSRYELALEIARQYIKMYAEERMTSTLKEESTYDRTNGECLMINRTETNGIWRIWGHGLADLWLHKIYKSPNGDYYELSVSP
jgi:hypothetical protein